MDQAPKSTDALLTIIGPMVLIDYQSNVQEKRRDFERRKK